MVPWLMVSCLCGRHLFIMKITKRSVIHGKHLFELYVCRHQVCFTEFITLRNRCTNDTLVEILCIKTVFFFKSNCLCTTVTPVNLSLPFFQLLRGYAFKFVDPTLINFIWHCSNHKRVFFLSLPRNASRTLAIVCSWLGD